MNEAVGELLPLALGVAISPVPVIAVILMLLAPRARAASVAFLGGWVVGIALVVGLVALLVDPATGDEDAPTWVAVVKLVLGVVLLLLAAQQWRGRPRAGHDVELPGWMAAIDKVTPVRAAGLGALLSGLNPKNLALGVAAGVTIGGGGLSGGQAVGAAAVFIVLAASSVAVPVLGYLVAADRLRGPLDDLRVWLTAHNAAVMTVLLLVIGVALVGKGLAGL